MNWLLWFVTLDPWTLLPLVPGLALSLWARRAVKKALMKAASVTIEASGAEAATSMLSEQGEASTAVSSGDGPMVNFYDSSTRKLRLSPSVHEGRSLADVAISSHEAAFAGLGLLGRLRTGILLTASLGGLAAWIVVAAGVLYRSTSMVETGFALFSAVTIATTSSIPIEAIANRRAKLASKSFLAPQSSGVQAAYATAIDALAWRIVAIPLTSRAMKF